MKVIAKMPTSTHLKSRGGFSRKVGEIPFKPKAFFPKKLHQHSDLIRLSDILTISRNKPLRRPIQMTDSS